MRRLLWFEFWLAISVLIFGCTGGLYSTDVSRAYLDINGEVVNVYPTDYDKTIRASIEALTDMRAAVISRIDGRFRTDVEARTPNGSPLRLRFFKEGRNLTVVRVRTGSLGYRHEEYSAQIHAFIQAKIESSGNQVSTPRSSSISGPPPAAITAGQDTADDLPAAPLSRKPVGSSENETTALQSSESLTTLKADLPSEISSPPTTPSPDRNASTVTVVPKTPVGPQPDYIVFFENNSNSLSPEARLVLDQAVDLFFASPDSVILLSGYAHSDEDTDASQLVSESRTLTVKYYLISKGIDNNRIRAKWHGSNANTHREHRLLYRRVELRLTRGL